MNEKLTLADCFKYPNAKVFYDNIQYEIHYILKYTELVWLKTGVFEEGKDAGDIPISDCKLILRPLSDLTEGESNYCEKLEREFPNQYYTVNKKYCRNERDKVRLHFRNIKIVDYLRSINIDIDGFIEAGKAVSQ